MPRTLVQNAQYIAETIKPAIKQAIEDKGVTVPSTDSFLDYADRIAEIEGGGGGGKEIDISKADYSIGTNSALKISNGRIIQGFANMSGYHARPLDASGNWLDVDWSESFEIGVAFKFTAFPAYQGITGDGNNNSWRKAPRMDYDNSEGKINLCVYSDGSTLAIDAYLNYSLVINKWYFIKLKFVKSTMILTVDITEDFIIFTNLYSNTMAATPYHDAASLCFGGDAQQSNMTSNTFFIDTYNTYIKDDTGSIVWGTYAGAFDDGKYPVISGEYQLYDYIQTDGTQLIDTGRAITAGDVVETIFTAISGGSNGAYVWGKFVDPYYTALVIYPNNGFYRHYDHATVNDSPVEQTNFTVGKITEDSYTVATTLGGNYTLFDTASVKLYAFSVNGDYYLPCKRKSDGVFGLIDITNKTFFTDSAGGNPFVGGNPVGNFDVLPKYDYADGITYQDIGDSGIGSYRKIDTLSTALLNASAMTCEVCARFDSFVSLSSGPYARIITFGNDNQTGKFGHVGILYDGSSDYNLCVWDDTVDVSSGLCVWTPTDTHTVAIVKTTAGAIKIYVDSVIKYTGSSSLTITNTIIDYICQRSRYNALSDTQRQINGEVFAWRIYPRELTSVEVEQNYKADYQKYIVE